jgi:hypothetical protein
MEMNNLVKLLLQENSLLQGGRFGTHQMKGIEDMTIDTLVQTNSTNNRVIQTQHQQNHQFWW